MGLKQFFVYVIITSFPCVDAGSTTLASGGGAKDATPKSNVGRQGKGSMVNNMHLNV